MGGETSKEKKPLNEISPSLFSLRTLHPLFIQIDEFLIRRISQFWKSFHSLFKNLVINPVGEQRRCQYPEFEGAKRCVYLLSLRSLGLTFSRRFQ